MADILQTPDVPQTEKVKLLVSLREAARLLDCSYWTLVSWQKKGKLRTIKLGDHLRKVPIEEVRRLAGGGGA